MRARDSNLVTIEALMTDKLRHVLEVLLPSPRRGLYMCVWWRLEATCKTNNQIRYTVYFKPK